MKAIRVDVNYATGKRAGGVNPKDLNLVGHPSWQNIDKGVEIRLVANGNVAQYQNVAGVTVLEGEAAIDAAVDEIYETKYAVVNEALLSHSIVQKNIDLTGLSPDLTQEEMAKALYDMGALGVKKSAPACLCCELGKHP